MITSIDLAILDFIQEHLRSGIGDILMKLITSLGNHGIFYIAFAMIMLCVKKTRETGIQLTVALIAGFILCNILLKNAVARPRPYTITDFQIIIAPLKDFSFPSGHTFFAVSFAAIIRHNYRKWGIAAYILAALIGFSRLYLYVHYPTDVIAGAVLGIITGIGSIRLCNYIRQTKHIR